MVNFVRIQRKLHLEGRWNILQKKKKKKDAIHKLNNPEPILLYHMSPIIINLIIDYRDLRYGNGQRI